MQGYWGDDEDERENTGELLVRAAETMAKFDAQLEKCRCVSQRLRIQLEEVIQRNKPLKVVLPPSGKPSDPE